jgi:hypothetical protein
MSVNCSSGVRLPLYMDVLNLLATIYGVTHFATGHTEQVKASAPRTERKDLRRTSLDERDRL